MKKYLQISIVLSIFFLLVIFRHIRSSGEDTPVVVSRPSPTPDQNSQNSQNNPSPQPTQALGIYKNGTYTGIVSDAYYGNIQVQVIIANGKISDVVFLQFPNDNGTSRFINGQAMPLLKSEAIQAQNENVDIVSGASDSSRAFQESFASALQQAK